MGRPAVKERKPEAAPAAVEIGGCRHHWIIESPRGALSDGRCKICGEERQFRNSASDYIWDDDSSSGYGRGGGARPPGATSSRPVTRQPRRGNVQPRIAETAAGMINSIGLQNFGLVAILRDVAPVWATWRVDVSVSVRG